MATKKNDNKPEPKAKTPSPREKLNIKTKDNDWYETAFKRFSISQHRAELRRDPLASLSPPIKSDFQ